MGKYYEFRENCNRNNAGVQLQGRVLKTNTLKCNSEVLFNLFSVAAIELAYTVDHMSL